MITRVAALEKEVATLNERMARLELKSDRGTVPQANIVDAKKQSTVAKKSPGTLDVYSLGAFGNADIRVAEVQSMIRGVSPSGSIAIAIAVSTGDRLDLSDESENLLKRLKSTYTSVVIVVYHATPNSVMPQPAITSVVDYVASLRLDGTFKKARTSPENTAQWSRLVDFLKKN